MRHEIRIVPSPKFDAVGLVSAICKCGRYRSAGSDEHHARKAWLQHKTDCELREQGNVVE